MTTPSRPLKIFFLLSLLISFAVHAAPRTSAEVPTVFAIGEDGEAAFGPSALRIAPDGTFWVVNPADNTLLNIDPDGRIRRQLRFDGHAVGITDVEFSDDGELIVLDAAAEPPAVFKATPAGTVRERQVLSAQTEPSRKFRALGDVVDSPLATAISFGDHAGAADQWAIRTGTDATPSGFLLSGANSIEVKATRGVIRGLRILREHAKGTFVLVEEVSDGDPITVDATVRLYSRSGTLLGTGRVPLTEQFTYVESPVAVSEEGQVYLLRTLPGSLRISVLPLGDSVPDILPDPREPSPQVNVLSGGHAPLATPAITRSQIEANALAFRTNSTYYNQTSLTGSCSGRTAPRYLGTTPRTIASVAYDWGGFDSVSAYNNAIAAGRQAGDIDDAAEEECSRGVDCSGYVTRAWGLGGDGTKYSTCSLATISTVIPLSSLSTGDILTRCNVPNRGNHAVIFKGFAVSSGGTVTSVGSYAQSTGIADYESTTDSQFDRVVYIYSSWSRLNNYTPRRYNSLAVEVTTPTHISSTVSPTSGGPGMVATFSSTWRNGDSTPMTARITVKTPWGATADFDLVRVSGEPNTGVLFRQQLVLPSVGRYDYAVTVRSQSTGRSARYPASGYRTGPTVISQTSSCAGTVYSGTLPTGGAAVQPNGNYYFSSKAGTHSGRLTGPSGADFDLYLWRWNGSAWAVVASGLTSSSSEFVSYSGSSGYYYWLVRAYQGAGSYSLCISRP